MLSIQHKTSISSLLLKAFVLCWFSHPSVANEKSVDTELPTLPNWYQVEVVLFDQRNILGDEQPPKELNLEFPNDLIELHSSYQNTGIMRRPLFDSLSESSITQPHQANLLDRIYAYLGISHFRYFTENQSEINLVPEARIPYQADTGNSSEPQLLLVEQQSEFDLSQEYTDEDKTAETALPTNFNPVFEAPFRTLDKYDRDLNDTVRALNRRNYQVQFHQAWRFEVTSKQQSQWVLLKAGDNRAGRYAIEGALRFYKSRFLHFETDLWKLIFSDDSQSEIVLPEIPKKTMTSEEEVLVSAMRFSNRYLSLSPKPLQVPSLIQNALNAYNLQSIIPLYINTDQNLAIDSMGQGNKPYPIKAIWPIKQSKLIQEEEVYYIDHPQMGALVSIKAYEPVPINLPPLQPATSKEQVVDASN
jgi:hypothetical protein